MEDLLIEYLYKKNYDISLKVKILNSEVIYLSEIYDTITVKIIVRYINVERINYVSINKTEYNNFVRREKINKILNR